MDIQKIITDYVTQFLSSKLGERFGLSEKQVTSILNKLIPLLIGGMAKNAGKDEAGASSLVSAIQKDHDGSIFDKVGEMLGSESNKKEGSKILGHILGGDAKVAGKALAQEEGIEEHKATDLMQSVAPFIMGALGKKQSENSLDAASILGMFQKAEKTQSSQDNPLLSILNKQGGGKQNDVVSMAMKFLKGLGK